MSNKKGSPKDWTFFYYVRYKLKGLLNINVLKIGSTFFEIARKKRENN